MANHVRLRRAPPDSLHQFEALVTGIDSGMPPILLTVHHTGPASLKRGIAKMWVVESDDARFFPTLARAREYIDTFFEEAKEA